MPFEEFIFSWLLGFYLIYSGIQFLMGKAINRQFQLFFIGLIIERIINWKFHPGFDTFFILFTMIPLAFSIIGFIYLKRFDYSIDNFSNILDKNEDFLN
jgi:hypothetical protein